MAIRQISVFIENKPGRMAGAVKTLADADIDLRAMTLADTRDFGILRFIVGDVDKAVEVLKEDYIVKAAEVIAVKMDDKKGSLSKVLETLDAAEINIEYSYAFTAKTTPGAFVLFRVDDTKAAEKALSDAGFTFLREADI